MKYESYEFQTKATEQLTEAFKKLWKREESQLEIILKAPTGSGKTYITTHFIDGLNRQPDWDDDIAFVWVTFSDELIRQSKKKFEEYFNPNISNGQHLLQEYCLNSDKAKLERNDVLYVNWQKLVSRKAEDRKLRRPEDERMLKESGAYFEDVVENTHKEGRKIVLIIDESHTHITDQAKKNVIEPLDPKIILKVSATPFKTQADEKDFYEKKGRDMAEMVEVDRKDVVTEGLIKKEIVSQTEEDLKKHEAEDLDKLLIDLAIDKRQEIRKEWKKIGKKINPLILIQLPDDDIKRKTTGEKTKEEIVTEYLTNEKGIKEEEIAKWFDDKKENLDGIEENDNKVKFLLFKYAAGTGWDCPRAHVMVMFREIKSDTFKVQTLGRIMRMASKDEEAKNSDILSTGYLYTNYRKNEVNNPQDTTENKPKTETSTIQGDRRTEVVTQQFVSDIMKVVKDAVKKSELKKNDNDEKKIDEENISKKTENVVQTSLEGLMDLLDDDDTETQESDDDAKVSEPKADYGSEPKDSKDQKKEKIVEKIKDAIKEETNEEVDEKTDGQLSAFTQDYLDTLAGKKEIEITLDPMLKSDFMTRADYGDLGKSSDFQMSFCKSMNKFFNIDGNELRSDKESLIKPLEDKGIDASPELKRNVLVNAKFKTENDDKTEGSETEHEVSDHDVEREFTWKCFDLLNSITEEDAKIGNVARSWGTFKGALIKWFSSFAFPSYYKQIDYYKVFLKDVYKEANSVFLKAITQALKDYKPTLDEYVKKRVENASEQESHVFKIKTSYAYTIDDKPVEYEASKSIIQPFRASENQSSVEKDFIQYLESNKDKIEWWFKNGDKGRDYFAIRYRNETDNKYSLFYPDWIIKFNNAKNGNIRLLLSAKP